MTTREIFEQWLSRKVGLAGVFACGVGFPNKSVCSLSISEEYPKEVLENTWRCVGDTFEVSNLHRFGAVHVRWIYENAQIYCSRRLDRIFLAVIMSKEPGAVDAAAVEEMFEEFKKVASQEIKSNP